jgi:type I restriction-modification system DNA methylase subunit
MEAIIDKIRGIFRKEGVTGMDSINHCIIFVISRMLNDEKCKKYKIDRQYAYDNIMKDDDGDIIGDQELYDRIFKKGKASDCLIGQIVNKLGFKNIKFKLESPQHVKQIMKELEKLDFDDLDLKYDIIGTIYEYHLKSGTSNAMRDLGQYYTNRQIINYMIKLCEPKLDKKGNIETIVDPTMGTGGFLTMSIKYLNEKYKNKIDWSKNKNNIYGFDIDENVKNMALLNILLENGELCENTILKNDTLYNDFKLLDNTILEKVDVILANEPMGLKNIIHASCCERIKELKIRGTKAEPLFLQLFMQSLNDGGRCSVVVPDGVLFNDSNLHSDTRKYLIENFNLKKVIGLNDDFFLNTGVKTSILFFVKDGKTKEVEFSEVKLNKDELVEKSIIKVDYKKIVDTEYSLFVNKYNVKEIVKIEGVKYEKLGDVCEFLQKSKRQASFGKEEGNYPFYTSGITVKRCDDCDYNEECVIIGTGGTANIKYNNNFSCSADNFILKFNKNIMTKYVYYYYLININVLENGFCGSTIKHISKDYVQNLEIPIPSLEVQQKIVDQLDVIYKNIQTTKDQIEESKKIMKYYVETMTLWEKDDKLENQIIFESKNKKLKASDGNKSGKYKFITSSQDRILYRDDYEFEKKHIILGRGGNASIHMLEKFGISHDDCYVISSNKQKLEYIYYYLLTNKDIIEKGFVGSTIKHLSKSFINDMLIKIPSLEKQKEIVSYCDEIQDTINKMDNRIKSNEILMKNIMETYLKTNNKLDDNESEKSEDTEDEIIEPKKTIKKPTKKVSNKEETSESEESEDEKSKPKKPTKKVSKKN